MNPNEVWIPLSMFIGLSVVLSLWVWFRYKAKRDLQETIRTAIEKGEGLSPELIENLVNPPVSPQRDSAPRCHQRRGRRSDRTFRAVPE